MKNGKRSIFVIALAAAMVLAMALGSFVSAGDDAQTLKGSASLGQTVLESGDYKIASNVIYSGGIRIADGATVYIDIPEGLTLSCIGSNGDFQTLISFFSYSYDYRILSTPGIEVGHGATLHITGEGSLNVKGGDGFHGLDGGESEDIFAYVWSLYPLTSADSEKMQILGGPAGKGGQGAIAPSPAIGGAAGIPGSNTGFGGGFLDTYKPPLEELGKSENGNNGGNGSSMGTVYIEGSVSVTAAAGEGDYNIPGKGATETGAKYTEYGFSGYTKLYGILTKGAPGGGGSAANASAIIGGGGGAGGSGGSGLSGGAKLIGGTNVRNFEYTTTFTNGSDGTAETGGAGGISYQPKIAGYDKLKAGAGGVRGTNGEGGILYISETASVNGIAGSLLTRTDLGGATADQQGQGAEVKRLTRVEVTAKLGNDPYCGRKVHVANDALGKLDLTEDPGNPGTYFGYVPTGSENLKIYTDSEYTSYSISAPDSTLVSQFLQFQTCQVDLSLDGGAYGETGDHRVTLMKGTTLTNTLTENPTGVFKANVCLNKEGKDTYDIYVDGVSYEKTLTVAEGVKISAPFYTMTVNVKLNSSGVLSDYAGREVTLSKGDRFVSAMTETADGVYTAIAAGEDQSGVIQYTIGIGDDRSANLLTAQTGAEATIDYYNISISLMDGAKSWNSCLVNIMGDGKLKNAPEVTSGGKGTGVYKVILFGEDDTEYAIVVDGVVTRGRIQATDPGKRDRTVNFFTASVALNKDGKVWDDGASVILRLDGEAAYVLPYSKTTKTYTAHGVEADTYDVYVYGAASGENTGEQISSGTVKTIDYYTITYHKNITGSTAADKVQIYQKNTVPTPASAPYEQGYTFVSWKVGADADTADYSPEAITALKDLYAAWVRPRVSLGGLVRCSENGGVSQSGNYLKFANLAIEGYPLNKAVIGTITITLENVRLTGTDLPEGWSNEGKWDSTSGNGKYVLQADTGNKLTVAQAQEYLRSLVFARNKPSGECSVQMSVYGNTTAE